MDESPTKHHVMAGWGRVVLRIQQEIARQGVHPARAVVLVPYAQLIPVARAAWAGSIEHRQRAHFVPRFETTMNWSASLPGLAHGADDLRLDAAPDHLTAASLLRQGGLATQSVALAGRLMEAAWSLCRVAAAQAPQTRAGWGASLATALDAAGQPVALQIETRLGLIALAWAASSSYATDVLFSAQADLLVLIEGLQPEPLHQSLRLLWKDRALSLTLDRSDGAGELALHAARDPEDEAERASACVLAHLAQGRSPVALVAQDRVLTRRVRALLAQRGVGLRDETGWTLSTTRAAATVVGFLRALAWDASTDAVLDWTKNAPAFDVSEVSQLEVQMRRDGTRDWRRVAVADGITAQVQAARQALQKTRPLSQWLKDVRGALQRAGQWQALLDDAAGQAVLDALRLRPGAEDEFASRSRGMGQGSFVAWVSQALEAGSFMPPHPAQAQVVVLPLGQLLGRPVAAVVFPGCDELNMSPAPEPPGMWTDSQRRMIGLPPREQLALATRVAWQYALRFAHVDILWRGSQNGERLMPSPFVLELLLAGPVLAPELRVSRSLLPTPCGTPRPSAVALQPARLTASAYEDLRRCPYRFFALRQLGLREFDELDTDLDKRDFGNWLHVLLKHFHQALVATPAAGRVARELLIDDAARQATQELGLDEGEFLGFAAAWPRVRTGYLDWLLEHEAAGASFVAAEASREMPLGGLTLVGRIDRIDRLSGAGALLIDYKTEPRSRTGERIREGTEDTQLAFYGALLHDDTVAAMYLNIGETENTHAYPQANIVELRDLLLTGILDDMRRIAQGALLPATGAPPACDHCAARGLCRKDFWDVAAHAEPGEQHA